LFRYLCCVVKTLETLVLVKLSLQQEWGQWINDAHCGWFHQKSCKSNGCKLTLTQSHSCLQIKTGRIESSPSAQAKAVRVFTTFRVNEICVEIQAASLTEPIFEHSLTNSIIQLLVHSPLRKGTKKQVRSLVTFNASHLGSDTYWKTPSRLNVSRNITEIPLGLNFAHEQKYNWSKCQQQTLTCLAWLVNSFISLYQNGKRFRSVSEVAGWICKQTIVRNRIDARDCHREWVAAFISSWNLPRYTVFQFYLKVMIKQHLHATINLAQSQMSTLIFSRLLLRSIPSETTNINVYLFHSSIRSATCANQGDTNNHLAKDDSSTRFWKKGKHHECLRYNTDIKNEKEGSANYQAEASFMNENTFTEALQIMCWNLSTKLDLPEFIVDEACKVMALSLIASFTVTRIGFEEFRIAVVTEISNPGRINLGMYTAYVLKNKKWLVALKTLYFQNFLQSLVKIGLLNGFIPTQNCIAQEPKKQTNFEDLSTRNVKKSQTR